jgi:hypothetical protein
MTEEGRDGFQVPYYFNPANKSELGEQKVISPKQARDFFQDRVRYSTDPEYKRQQDQDVYLSKRQRFNNMNIHERNSEVASGRWQDYLPSGANPADYDPHTLKKTPHPILRGGQNQDSMNKMYSNLGLDSSDQYGYTTQKIKPGTVRHSGTSMGHIYGQFNPDTGRREREVPTQEPQGKLVTNAIKPGEMKSVQDYLKTITKKPLPKQNLTSTLNKTPSVAN